MNSFFPVYKNDGYSILSLNKNQIKATVDLVQKINSKEYDFVDNPCQCGNEESTEDIVVTEKDAFGVPNSNILCFSCGLIRSQRILSEKDMASYYNHDYKKMYYDLGHSTSESYYKSQKKRGKEAVDFAKKFRTFSGSENVYDMGCGAGGVMHYFHELGMNCSGNDYSEKFLDYGRSIGMDLHFGDLPEDKVADDSIDIFILSHVYEHLVGTKSYLEKIFSKIKLGGILIMEVPGAFSDFSSKTGYPLSGCQFAHVVNFYHKNFLASMFQHFNLNILYGDEKCLFLVEKTKETSFDSDFRFIDLNKDNFKKVKKHLIKTTNDYKSMSNLTFVKRKVANVIKGKMF